MSKKLLAALLAVCMVASLLFVPAAAATFNDVAEDHWAANAIERWADYDVLNGKDAVAGIFDPSAPMTRAEFASMLVKMLGLTAKSDKTFDDVSADAWYAEVVSIAVKAGIINGKTAGNFAPNDPVTFEEAAVMMCRAFGLAQTTGGADWSKESIDKLTELGMIGEGADEHLQVGVDCNRAVVAALADAVVAEYVNEDKAEPITGEIKGVVLVVKGAKVEIKDATVAAPIVVESAELTLTNTKAEDVKVSGKDAAIAADEASSVANVTLAGEAPKADIKGDVASVTIAEETTGAVIDAPKADADSIVNNSTEDATVNGETVEGKPEETTDPENPDDGDYNGSVSGGGDVPAPAGPADKIEHTHNWNAGVVTTEATCKKDGVKTFTCVADEDDGTYEPCGATKTEVIPMVAHVYEQDATVCKNCGAAKPETECTDETHAALTAEQKRTVTIKEATCAEAGSKATYCTICNAELSTEPIAKLTTHTTGSAWVVEGTQHGHQCSVCYQVVDLAAHSVTRYTASETVGKHTGTCSICHATVEGTCAAAEPPVYGKNATQHWTICKDCRGAMTPADHNYNQEENTKCVCGAEKPATTTHTCNWVYNSEGAKTATTHTMKCIAEGTCPDRNTKTEAHKWTADGSGEGWNASTGKRTCTVCSYEDTCSHSNTTVKANSCTSGDGSSYTHTTVCGACGHETTGVACSDSGCSGRPSDGSGK